jgi:broad-specificity NMP kinase
MTEKWAEKVSQNHRECQKIILEGQVNLNFICSAFQERATIVLLDCSEEEISRRLKERNQLELASPEMENWRKYLRRQAEET